MSNASKQTSKSGDARRRALMDEMQFLGQMSSTETALFHHTVAAKAGLTVTDMKTVSILMQEGPATASQLAARLHLTPGAVTSVIDRVEVAGLASRASDPNDRRKVIVQANWEKLEQMSNPYESMGAAFEKLLGNYTTEEIEFLTNYLKASIELTKSEIEKVSGQS